MVNDEELYVLSQRVGEALQRANLKLVTAESCTGGWVSKSITDIAGSSAWFVCGFSTYSNNAKSKQLGVSDITLDLHGAVSEETAFEMAEGALQRAEGDVALAVTGIAGPGGGTADKPVGTVCFAWCRRNQAAETATRHFDGDRERIRRLSVAFVLERLLGYLMRPQERPARAAKDDASVSDALPVKRTSLKKPSPFDMMDSAKAQLGEMLDPLRIDRTVFAAEPTKAEQLAGEYRATIATLDQDFRKQFLPRIHDISQLIQEACEIDGDAMIGCAHLDGDGAYTVLHPLHQGIFVETITRCLGLPPLERESIVAAALTSNIAMLNLQEILQRQNTPLTPLQLRLLQWHPFLGNEMLLELGVDDPSWSAAVLSHHERVDGKGYPAASMGDQIPLPARVIALADVYDAMIKPRQYRDANQRKALRQLFLERGEAIDAHLTPIAIKEIGIYPPGSFVKLHNGEVGIVIKRVVGSLHPIVRSVVGPRGAPLERPFRRNTEEAMFAIQDVVPRDRSLALNLRRIWDYGR